MKTTLKTLLVASAILLPFAASAQTNEMPKGNTMMQGGMKGSSGQMNMSNMHDMMGSMMGDMQGMMGNIQDPEMKKRMQKMYDQMGSMMQNMASMNCDNKAIGNENKPAGEPAANDPHHPKK